MKVTAFIIGSISCQWSPSMVYQNRPAPPTTDELAASQRQFGSAHQGTVCGDDKTYRLETAPRNTMILQSPFYPAIVSEQLQCQWIIHGIPGRRIKLEFVDFFLSKGAGDSCHQSYLALSDYLSDGTAKVNGGTFRLCGHNPGVYISQGADMKIDLVNDKLKSALKRPQRFKIIMSITDKPSKKVNAGELVIHEDFNARQVQQAAFPGIQLKSAVNHNQYRHRPTRMPIVATSLPMSPGQDDMLVSHDSDNASTMPVIIGLAFGGLLLGIVGVLILVRLNRKKEVSDETPEK